MSATAPTPRGQRERMSEEEVREGKKKKKKRRGVYVCMRSCKHKLSTLSGEKWGGRSEKRKAEQNGHKEQAHREK